jgi:hypothetical protein
VVVAWEETNIREEFPARASVLPSPEKAIVVHPNAGKVRDVQVKPESVEMKTPPGLKTAANREPSAEEVTELQGEEMGAVVAVQLVPESAEMYTCPLLTAATSRRPSAEEATELQPWLLS